MFYGYWNSEKDCVDRVAGWPTLDAEHKGTSTLKKNQNKNMWLPHKFALKKEKTKHQDDAGLIFNKPISSTISLPRLAGCAGCWLGCWAAGLLRWLAGWARMAGWMG